MVRAVISNINGLAPGGEDRERIIRATATEAAHGLDNRNPNEYRRMVEAIADTILNRAASPQFPGTIKGVLDQKNQFSAINGPQRSYTVYGSVDNIPSSIVPAHMREILNKHLDERLAGKPSTVGGGTHYANPHFSDARNLGWISALEGPRIGQGNSVHYHGTAAGTTPVEAELNLASAQWLQPLISDPKHLMRELEALGTDEAKQKLADINRVSVVDTKYKEQLAKGAQLVAQQSKHALSKAGIETSSRNLSLAEIVGGQTAVKLLQTTDKSVTLEKLIADGILPKSLVAEFTKNVTPETKKEVGLSQEKQDNPEKMTLEEFLSYVDADGKKQKLSAADKVRGNLKNPSNRSFLDEMSLADLGVGGFFMLLIGLLISDAMGIDASQFLGSFLGGRGEGRIGNGSNGYSTNSGSNYSTVRPETVGSYSGANRIANRSYTDVSTVPYLKLPDAVKPDVAGGWTAYAISTEAGNYRGPMAKGMIVFRAPDGTEHRYGFVSGGGTGGEDVRGGPAPGLNALKSDSRPGVNAVYQLGRLEVGGRGDAFTGDNGQNFFIHTPSNAQSQVGRSEIGIHPDGGNYGTAGCFGLDPTKTAEFIKMWNSIPPDQRPTQMYVIDPKLLKQSEVAVTVAKDPNDPTKFTPVSVAPTPEKRAGISPDVQRIVAADPGIAAAAASMKPVAATPVGNDTIASAQAALAATGAKSASDKPPVAPAAIVTQNIPVKPSVTRAHT